MDKALDYPSYSKEAQGISRIKSSIMLESLPLSQFFTLFQGKMAIVASIVGTISVKLLRWRPLTGWELVVMLTNVHT